MMKAPEGTQPLFVYGSLRPGQVLWPWLRESVHEGRAYQAWVRGYRLAYSAAGDYPVMLEANYRPADKLVRGTLVFARNTEDFRAIWRMETGAGYDVNSVQVLTGAHVEALEPIAHALAFTFPTHKYAVGEYLMPHYSGPTLAVWDWAQRPKLVLPGVEEIQSIPSQKRSGH